MNKFKCDCCGKFRKKDEVVQQGEYSSDGHVLHVYLECKFCMSPFDFERFGFSNE